MFDISTLAQVEIQILIFFAIGFFLKKNHITDIRTDVFLSVLVLNCIMPINIFVAFYENVSIEVLKESYPLVIAGTIVAILVLVIGKVLPSSIEDSERRILQYSMLISNGSLIGLPLLQGLLGNMGVLYANIFMIPTRILSFTSGEKFFNPQFQGANFTKVLKQFFLNAVTLAMVFGLVLNISKIVIPMGIYSVCTSLSGCMTPIALILVGSTLYDSTKAKISGLSTLTMVSGFRLLIAPLITFVVCVCLNMNLSLTMVAVLVNATPVASTATIFARKYNGNTSFASNCVFVSTVLSMASLWLVCMLLLQL